MNQLVKKSAVFTAAATLAAFSLTSCSSGDTQAGTNKPAKIEKIGLMVQDMSNPFFSAMDKGAKEAAAKIGATANTQDAQLDLANQNTQIDTFIQQGVNLREVFRIDAGQFCVRRGLGVRPSLGCSQQARK